MISGRASESRAVGRHLGAGSAVAFAAGSYTVLALGLVSGPLVARSVGPEGRGQVGAALLFTAVVYLVVSMGVPVAVTHAVAAGRDVPAVFDAVHRIALAQVLPAILGAGVAAVWLLDSVDGGLYWCTLAMIVLTPVAVIGNSAQSALVARGRLGYLNRVRLGVFSASCAVVVVLFASGHLTTTTYGLLLVGQVVAGTILHYAVLAPHAGERTGTGAGRGRSDSEARVLTRQIAHDGLRGWGSAVASFATERLDQSVVLAMLGSASLGHYLVAGTLAGLPLGLSDALRTRLVSDMTAYPEQRLERAGLYVRGALAAGFVCSIGLVSFGPVVLRALYGSAFGPSVRPMLLLLPGVVASCGSAALTAALVQLGRFWSITRVELGTLVIGLVGVVPCVDRWGIAGAAGLSSVAYVVRFALLCKTLKHLGPVRLLPRASDLTGAWRSARGAGAT